MCAGFRWLGAGLLLVAAASGLEAAAKVRHSEPLEHTGMCDASAGAVVTPDLFVAANDEDSRLRVYSMETKGGPVASFDLAGFLKLEGKRPESDIEGGARVGDRVYWITSHGASASGERRRIGEAFFATEIRNADNSPRLTPVGRPYRHLRRDFLALPQLQALGFQQAAKLAPKEPGGLNIEGLCERAEGGLWIGFRNPLPTEKAVLVPLLNPAEVVAGADARLGKAELLDLRGLGVRDLARVGSAYYVVAGSHERGGKSALYRWDGGQAAPKELGRISFLGFNPEALIWSADFGPRELLVLSDDGMKTVGGVLCKDLPETGPRAFRSAWIRLPD